MSSPKLRLIFRPQSEIQTFFSPKIRWSPKKKKKRSSPKLRLIFRPDSFRSVGGDASQNGVELFKIKADFSAKIVTFRLVGGMHPPIPPPKSATDPLYPHVWERRKKIGKNAFMPKKWCVKYSLMQKKLAPELKLLKNLVFGVCMGRWCPKSCQNICLINI